jgi:hypothetical protein
MTYTLRNIPDTLWKQIKLNAEMSGLPIRTYILLALERNNVKFKIVEPNARVDSKSGSGSELEQGVDNSRMDRR